MFYRNYSISKKYLTFVLLSADQKYYIVYSIPDEIKKYLLKIKYNFLNAWQK